MSTNHAFARLDAAVSALAEVDVSAWSDAALHDHLDRVSTALCQVDAQLARLADAVRARGLSVREDSLAA